MDAPKCKICGLRHYGPCSGAPAPVFPERETAPLPTPKAIMGGKKGFDRNAYQREYMIERRKSQVPVNAIYAIVQHDEPDIVKIGQTKKWDERKTNFSKSKSYAVYFIGTKVDLKMIENACLKSMGMTPCRGKEWFKSSIEHANSCIELILNTLHAPYTVKYGSHQATDTGKSGPFNRNDYQRNYMRERRKKLV
jgi:hypothetical protein